MSIETSERRAMPDLAAWEPNYNEVFYLLRSSMI